MHGVHPQTSAVMCMETILRIVQENRDKKEEETLEGLNADAKMSQNLTLGSCLLRT